MIDVVLFFIAMAMIIAPIFFVALVLEDEIQDILEDLFK